MVKAPVLVNMNKQANVACNLSLTRVIILFTFLLGVNTLKNLFYIYT